MAGYDEGVEVRDVRAVVMRRRKGNRGAQLDCTWDEIAASTLPAVFAAPSKRSTV